MNKNNKVYTVIFTFVFTFIFILLLTVVYSMSKDKILLNQTVQQEIAVLTAMAIPYTSKEEAAALYDSIVTSKEIDGLTVYSTTANGTSIYLVEFSGNALWGTVTGVLAVNEDITRIIGMQITDQNETPGLGGRIAEEWYTSQFTREKLAGDTLVFNKASGKGNYDPEDGTVDTVTGATRTSESLEAIINSTITSLKKMKSGGKL